MSIPAYQYALGEFARLLVKPRLEPLVVPRSPTRHDYYSGIPMPEQYGQPQGNTMLAYLQSPTQISSQPNIAPPSIYSTKVFVGVAPVRGVYTGVKNGRY